MQIYWNWYSGYHNVPWTKRQSPSQLNAIILLTIWDLTSMSLHNNSKVMLNFFSISLVTSLFLWFVCKCRCFHDHFHAHWRSFCIMCERTVCSAWFKVKLHIQIHLKLFESQQQVNWVLLLLFLLSFVPILHRTWEFNLFTFSCYRYYSDSFHCDYFVHWYVPSFSCGALLFHLRCHFSSSIGWPGFTNWTHKMYDNLHMNAQRVAFKEYSTFSV